MEKQSPGRSPARSCRLPAAPHRGSATLPDRSTPDPRCRRPNPSRTGEGSARDRDGTERVERQGCSTAPESATEFVTGSVGPHRPRSGNKGCLTRRQRGGFTETATTSDKRVPGPECACPKSAQERGCGAPVRNRRESGTRVSLELAPQQEAPQPQPAPSYTGRAAVVAPRTAVAATRSPTTTRRPRNCRTPWRRPRGT